MQGQEQVLHKLAEEEVVMESVQAFKAEEDNAEENTVAPFDFRVVDME